MSVSVVSDSFTDCAASVSGVTCMLLLADLQIVRVCVCVIQTV